LGEQRELRVEVLEVVAALPLHWFQVQHRRQ